jgi:peptide/nickel transport system permease protein
LGYEARQAFYEKHKLNRPGLFNFHKRLELVDRTSGTHTFSVTDQNGSALTKLLELHLAPSTTEGPDAGAVIRISSLIFALSEKTTLQAITKNKPWFETKPHHVPDAALSRPSLAIVLSDNTQFAVFVDSMKTVGELLARLNAAAGDPSRFEARISSWSPSMLFDSQFFWHLYESVTFKGQSYATDQSLVEIVAERGKFSLALTLPMVALSWLLGMIISCFVAYYRDSWIDRLGVFLAVLGMCVPYLAYMLIGQWVMFRIAPSLAAGLSHPSAIYVPVLIAVIAGLGGYVRFYRTIILDQVNQDYVRTARAKGVNLPGILFKHVLRNSMLPILTNLVSTIPFLIMGSLLLERFFGIPGLGDLMLTSIYSRDVPIITGLTFLTSVLYVLSLLATDVLYAVFDPRVRLQ